MSLHVVGIAGSLRAGSFNRALLAAAVELAPAGMTIEVADLRPIPLYDGDVEAAGVPAAVAELKSRVRGAGALLIATPEYNYSVPGVLKNALDWLSRGPDSALAGRPAALMGASPGGFGTVRAQNALRQVAQGTNLLLLQRPPPLPPGLRLHHHPAARLRRSQLRPPTTPPCRSGPWVCRPPRPPPPPGFGSPRRAGSGAPPWHAWGCRPRRVWRSRTGESG